MTLFPVWVTFAEGSITTAAAVLGAQWVERTAVRSKDVFPPRSRGDVWMLTGDIRSSRRTEDTWEGEAT